MTDSTEDLRARGMLFRSLRRPKKEKSQTTTKKKNSSSKSIFSSLMLANYEQQMQLDPTANIANTNFELWESPQKSIRDKCKQKINSSPANENGANSESPYDDSINSASIHEESDEENFHIDPYICEVYESIINIVSHGSDKKADTGVDEEDENDDDMPTIDTTSAIAYLKDAFGLSDDDHIKIVGDNNNTQEGVIQRRSKTDAVEAHIMLTKILLKHELLLSQTPNYYWRGGVSFLTNEILKRQTDFEHIDEITLAFIRWSAYADVHKTHPLNPSVFVDLLDKLSEVYVDKNRATLDARFINSTKKMIPAWLATSNNNASDKSVNGNGKRGARIQHLKTEDERLIELFWIAARSLGESFLNFVEDLNSNDDLDSVKTETLLTGFQLLIKLKRIETRRKVVVDEEEFFENFENSMRRAVMGGVCKNIDKFIINNRLESFDAVDLDALMKFVDFIKGNYLKFSDKFAKLFKENLNFNYSECVYKAHTTKLSEVIKPSIFELINNDKLAIDTSQSSSEKNISKKLFQLYLQLKIFVDLGLQLFDTCDFPTEDYFNWFSCGIDIKSKITIFNANMRIEKSIKSDSMKPVNSSTKHSDSAVDSVTILKFVKKFWEDMKWPNKTDISGDICRFAMVYIRKIVDYIGQSEAMKNMGIFKVPIEVCVALNNINFVMNGVEQLLDELCNGKISDHVLTQEMLSNTQHFARMKKLNLIEESTAKVTCTIRKLLIEGAEVKTKAEIGDRIIIFIEDSLNTLRDDLSRDDFENSRTSLWRALLDSTDDVIECSRENNRPPVFYSNLRTIFHALQDLFEEFGEKIEPMEKVKQINFLLERHGLNTQKLIHQYFIDRYQMQQKISRSPFHPYGLLSISCYFLNNTLKLEILNAKNLIPIGNTSNRKCDSFVKVCLIPEEVFPKYQNLKTKVEHDTHFPLYEERFELELTAEQRNMDDAIIFFNIKDKSLFGTSECLAEAFLSFNDIPDYSNNSTTAFDTKFVKQIHLTLTRLQSDDMESLNAISLRSIAGDKSAKEFLAKLKSKTLLSASKLKVPITKL